MGNSGHVIFCQEFPHNERGVCRRSVMVQKPVSVLPHPRPFVPHIFPQSPQNLAIKIPIDSLTTWNKLLMHNSSNVKKMISIDLMLLRTWRAERTASSVAKTAALFPGHNCTAMIHHQL